MALDNLIGSRLSLISQQDARYDGILFSINAKESSIILRNVKCFGTEDRVKEEYKKIPPNPVVLAFVTFPGNEIKDLSVFESSENEVEDDNKKSAESSQSQQLPPAPPAQQQQRRDQRSNQQRSNQNYQNNNNNKYNNNNNSENQKSQNSQFQQQNNSQQQRRPQREQRENNDSQRNFSGQRNNNNNNNNNNDRPQRQQQSQSQSQNQSQAPRNNERNQEKTSSAGTGEHLARMRLKGADQKADDASSIKNEFDFAAGLSSFNKTEVLATVASEGIAVNETKYVKDDFFDSLSSGDKGGKYNPSEERSLNQDTFGAIAVQQNYRRGGGGGYRGGRGNRGYRNNNNRN